MKIETEYDFDFFVIGGGSGGLSAAKKAAKFGAKVGLADYVHPTPMGTKWGLGGTCVNVGCIPKKLMHFTSSLGEAKNDMVCSGWEIDEKAQHNWSKMLANVNTHIKRLNWGYKKQLLEVKVKYFNSFASLKDNHTISLINKKGKEQLVTSEKILIATGGRPTYLDMPNIRELAITSDDIFWKKEAPGKTLVIGGGYIAVECAGFLRGLGYEVDMLIRSVMLRNFDRDMIERVYRDMNKKGVNMLVGNLKEISKEGNIIKTKCLIKENADVIRGGALTDKEINENLIEGEYQTVLLAIGRHPETKNLNLENAGVEVNNKGKIPVNEYYQTNVENIFAIGDLIQGSPELTPVAIKEGIKLAQYLYQQNDQWKPINYNVIPTTIFSPLEYSLCGLSEEKAIEIHGEENIDVYHSSFKPLEWNFCEEREDSLCYTKVIVTKGNEVVLGIHYAGPNAGEVMQAYGLALIRETTFSELKEVSKIN